MKRIERAIVEWLDRLAVNGERTNQAIALGCFEAEIWDLGIIAAQHGYSRDDLPVALRDRNFRMQREEGK